MMRLVLDPVVHQRQSLAVGLAPGMMRCADVLRMSAEELTAYVREQASVNPLIELVDCPRGAIRSSRLMDEDPLLKLRDRTEETMEADLLSQLRLLSLPTRTFHLAAYLVRNLDANGWLALSLEEAAELLGESLERMQKALDIVQSLHPAGIGARTLKECLLLQIVRDDKAPPLAAPIISNFLHELAADDSALIARSLNVNLAQVEEAISYIKGLQPRPGSCYIRSAETDLRIEPDAWVIKQGDAFVVRLNDRLHPSIAIQSIDLHSADFSARREAARFWKPFLQSARLLAYTLEQRKQTLLKVLQAMVAEQRPYLEQGAIALKPMTLSTIAEAVGMHPSTISRTVSNKYVSTPHGTVPLKSWFSNGIAGQNSEAEVSSVAVKETIASLIRSEDPDDPLSDARLAERLASEGMRIARRTVAKYREELNIPSSRMRKRRKDVF